MKWEAKLKEINGQASKFKFAQEEKAPAENVDKELAEERPSLELEIIEFRKPKNAWDVIQPTLAEIAPNLKVLDLRSEYLFSSVSHLCHCFHHCLPPVESSLTDYSFSFVVITTWESHLCYLVSQRWQVWRSLTYVKTIYQGTSNILIMKKKLIFPSKDVFPEDQRDFPRRLAYVPYFMMPILTFFCLQLRSE